MKGSGTRERKRKRIDPGNFRFAEMSVRT